VPPAASAEELGQVREELRRLRADREEDRRAIRVLEARLAAQRPTPIAQPGEVGRASHHPLIPQDLAVVRLAPTTSQQQAGEVGADDEEPYVFIADGGSKAPKAPRSTRRTGGPDAAPALPVDVPLALPQSAQEVFTSAREPEASKRKGALSRGARVEGSAPRAAGAIPSQAQSAPLLVLEQAEEEGGDEAYRSGVEALEAGDPARAVGLLEGFVKEKPRHRSADNAVLALGEAWLALNKPGNALQAFERVVREYPAGDVVPEALLRYGETCVKLGRNDAAQAAFQRLVEDHPTSAAARRAQVHLATR